MTNVSHNVLQMCTEVYNSTPGNVLKKRIIKIVAKLLLEYGEHSKELTDQLEEMMREIKKFDIDTKLSPNFLTTMLTVINVLHQKRDEETDEFLGNDEAEEEEEPTKEIKNIIYINPRTKTLGPRKLTAKRRSIT